MDKPFKINRAKLEGMDDEQRKDVERDLELLYRTIDANPLLTYFPHPKQVKFHEARTPIKAFIGGNRSGKSTAGVCDDLIQAVDRVCLPDHLVPFKRWDPPFYCRIISPDFTSTMEGVIFNRIRQWAPKDQLVGGNWADAYDKQRRVLRFKNGSWFVFNTLEQDVDKHSGIALHRVHWDEEPGGPHGIDIRKENLMRLIDFDGDELYTMTPLFGLSWVHDEIWEKRNTELVTAVQVDIDDNPHLSESAKARILDSAYTKEELLARKSGQFVHFEGKFYPEFKEDVHAVEPPKREKLQKQKIVIGIDPGFNRTGVVFCAFDEDNACVVFDELYPEKSTVDVVARAIKDREKQWGVKASSYVIDPSARARNAINAEQISTEYLREGIPCEDGQNARGPGILEMKRRWQQGTLTVSKLCSSLIWEIGRYRRDPKSDNEFDAIKVDDHLLDALRYVVMSRAWGSPPMHQHRQYRSAYRQNHQVPYKQEKFPPKESPPLGELM